MYIQVFLMFPLGYGRVKLQKKKKEEELGSYTAATPGGYPV